MLALLSSKVNDFEGCIDFDLRDTIRAERRKSGRVPAGNPTAPLLRPLDVQVA